LFGLGYGPVHESLPFAAAVLESVRRTQPAPAASAPALVNAGRRDPADSVLRTDSRTAAANGSDSCTGP
ncbi:hypothetical protein B5180_15045, partial [Streptomyces sp. BF-3]